MTLGSACHGICTSSHRADFLHMLLLPFDAGYVQVRWSSSDGVRCPTKLLCRQDHADYLKNPPELERSGHATLFAMCKCTAGSPPFPCPLIPCTWSSPPILPEVHMQHTVECVIQPHCLGRLAQISRRPAINPFRTYNQTAGRNFPAQSRVVIYPCYTASIGAGTRLTLDEELDPALVGVMFPLVGPVLFPTRLMFSRRATYSESA